MMCSLHVSLHPDHSRDSVATTNQKQPFEFTTARLVVDEPADVRWTLLAFQPAAMADERELWLEDADLVSLSLFFYHPIQGSRLLRFLHTWCIFLNSFILSLLYTHIDKRRKKLCVYSHNSALSGCECAVMVFLPIHIVGEREREMAFGPFNKDRGQNNKHWERKGFQLDMGYFNATGEKEL